MKINITEANETPIEELQSKLMSMCPPDSKYLHSIRKKFGSRDDHYRLLAFLSQRYVKNGLILEIGTSTGMGAAALGINATNRVISYDVTSKKREMARFAWRDIKGMPNVEFREEDIVDGGDHPIVGDADLIFLDPSPHDGYREMLFMRTLKKYKFRGMLLCDDINVPEKLPGLHAWWNSIKEEKKILPVGHRTGSGLVLFNNDKIEIER